MKSVLNASVCFCLFLCLFLLFSKHALAGHYVVRKGDTLASIARGYYGEPVFGPKGTINKIYRLNPATKAKPALEPGQSIALEDKARARRAPKAMAAAQIAPVPPPPAPTPSIAALTAPEETATAQAQPLVEQKPREQAVTVLHESPVETASATEQDELAKNFFWVVPSYVLIQKTATEVASGTSYTLHSSPALSAELGWDHWWNSSFSTILTGAITQLSSKETSDVSGSKVIDNMLLSAFDLALVNRIVKNVRAGLGLSYGDHLFLENFAAAPVDPAIYKIAFLNPFATVEWIAVEKPSFESTIALKAGALPAQVGHGHDLNSGYELSAQLTLLQTFNSWALLYGATYTTENQTRIDADETTSRWDFRIGAAF